MKSPFPGMDPFMELNWPDVHTALITYMRDQLQKELPRGLRAQLNERVVMELEDESSGPIRMTTYPDVSVSQSRTGGTAVATVAADETIQPDAIVQEEFGLRETEPFIQIIDSQTGSKIITVIELISPTNKLAGKGRDSYIAKQQSYLRSGVQLVEIDLTRAGDRRAVMPRLTQDLTPPFAAYLAVVHRSLPHENSVQREYYQLPLEKPLKPIRIPLRVADADIALRLQPLIEAVYENGRYEEIEYSQKLTPPLSFAEQAFLDQCLAARQ